MIKCYFFFSVIACILCRPLQGYSQQVKDGDYSIKLTLTKFQKGDNIVQLLLSRAIPPQESFLNPPTGFPFSSSRYFIINTCQAVYEAYLSGKITKDYWDHYLKGIDTKTLALSEKPVVRNRIGVFTALDKEGNKTIIIDINNNHDFGDDPKYIIKKGTDTLIRLKLNGSYYNGVTIKDSLFSVLMNSKQNVIINGDTLQQKLSISFINDAILSTRLKSGNNSYKFAMNSPLVPYNVALDNQILYLDRYDQHDHIINADLHNFKDTISINDRLYQIQKVDYSTPILKLKYLATSEHKGIEIGEKIYNFNIKDLITEKDINPEMFKGKYILLDFWGTWCKPCIQGIPDLVNLSKKNQDKLHIISIANDAKESVPTLKKIIATKGMNWSNIWNETNQGVLVPRFQIHMYPTFVLIDPSGKIIYKNSSIYTLADLEKLIL